MTNATAFGQKPISRQTFGHHLHYRERLKGHVDEMNDRVIVVSTKYFSVYSSFLKLKLVVEHVDSLRSGKDLGSASRKLE